MLSTYHERPDFQEVTSQRESRKQNPVVSLKPNVVVDYNKYMCGVDKQDQKLSSFPVMLAINTAYSPLDFWSTIPVCSQETNNTHQFTFGGRINRGSDVYATAAQRYLAT
ncbi:hypothetical protein J6590_071623 [Homalodisca vitripennis]|nr:hypothetical protein J6590_071623 [Homalodisca vitripennis]